MTSETDAEFVADMEWLHSHDREAALPPEKLARLFACARRGAGLALNQQYDVYAAAREEYCKKIAEQADEIERLRAALREIAGNPRGGKINTPEKFDRDEFIAIARAALEGK